MPRIIAFLIVYSCFAQSQPQKPSPVAKAPPAVFLPKDSPHLYRLFFYFHRSIDAVVQQQKMGRTPLEMQRIDRDVSANFGLSSVQVLPTLRTVSNSFGAELAAIDEEEKSHANARARMELSPIPGQMRSFEARRAAVVDRGLAALRTQLGPAEWVRFQNYINGAHRTSYSVVLVRP